MIKAFHRDLKRVLIELFSSDEVAPPEIAKRISKIMMRPCGREAASEINKFLCDRGIDRLIHFTPLENVKFICQYGLIPRDYLALDVMQMALHPSFTDQFRLEKKQEFNCLSLTHPNYKMFYSKRAVSAEKKWAVIEYSSEILSRFWAEYCPTNSASQTNIFPGGNGLRRQFLLEDLRKQLELASNETTDPQAEVLCDSVIGGHHIRRICVKNDEDVSSLLSAGIDSEVEESYFQPRHDYDFWKQKKITDLSEFQELKIEN